MDYFVNEIEEMINLNENIGIFKQICDSCYSISLTNFWIVKYSETYKKRINKLSINGLKIVEVDINVMNFKKINKSKLMGLCLGSVSTIYQAKKDKSCVITSNKTVYSACKKLSVNVISTFDFIQMYAHIKNIRINNKLKIV